MAYSFDVNLLDLKLITGVIGLPITISTVVYVSYISYRNKNIATHYKLMSLLLVMLYIQATHAAFIFTENQMVKIE